MLVLIIHVQGYIVDGDAVGINIRHIWVVDAARNSVPESGARESEIGGHDVLGDIEWAGIGTLTRGGEYVGPGTCRVEGFDKIEVSHRVVSGVVLELVSYFCDESSREPDLVCGDVVVNPRSGEGGVVGGVERCVDGWGVG